MKCEPEDQIVLTVSLPYGSRCDWPMTPSCWKPMLLGHRCVCVKTGKEKSSKLSNSRRNHHFLSHPQPPLKKKAKTGHRLESRKWRGWLLPLVPGRSEGSLWIKPKRSPHPQRLPSHSGRDNICTKFWAFARMLCPAPAVRTKQSSPRPYVASRHLRI